MPKSEYSTIPAQTTSPTRLRLTIHGTIQGVGFRPFIFRLAHDLNLTGWVRNTPSGVISELEGTPQSLEIFLQRVTDDAPSPASIEHLEPIYLSPTGYDGFQILESDPSGRREVHVPVDLATCTDCLREIFDPGNRRYGYPFTNCTQCGPRYSIINAWPYDRPNTTMRSFPMCEACLAEYNNPADRRFHAQPNACSVCGPRLFWQDRTGCTLAEDNAALHAAAKAIQAGEIVALKGLGGFHLIADARSGKVVRELRFRKSRQEKPFALMYPNMDHIEQDCVLQENEKHLLSSPEAPILLLPQQSVTSIDAQVAPGNPYLGVMLPYTPLHHLLMAELNMPVIATSGNLADEPICIDEQAAISRLGHIADYFLVHDRPIARHVDDSIVRFVAGREMLLRRGRGYTPYSMAVGHLADGGEASDMLVKSEPQRAQRRRRGQKEDMDFGLLAVGGHQKNTMAVMQGDEVFMSQHIGSLDTVEAYETFENVSRDLRQLYSICPDQIACDLHPDYGSTRYARKQGKPVIPVQHHHAHVVSCMAEQGVEAPVLGIVWDGTGYGTDGTVWGGEYLVANWQTFERVAHFRPFRLPGGELAVREPRRAAFGLLYEIFGDQLSEMANYFPVASFEPPERHILMEMLKKNINSPLTTSAGRLFDAVASLLGLRHQTSFEGQAAMDLEFAIGHKPSEKIFTIPLVSSDHHFILDWEPMVRSLLQHLKSGESIPELARSFHDAMVDAIITVAEQVALPRVVLTGGCFQNLYLCERAIEKLRDRGFQPYWHQHVPPNDGGIALGQAVCARYSINDRTNNHVPCNSR